MISFLRQTTVAAALVCASWAAVPVQAQDQTLADLRQELSVVYVEIQKLKRELSTTGLSGGTDQAGTLLERIETIEAQLQSVTARSEEIELRLNRVVKDGTTRIGDLEFRICELEPNCDISTIEFGSTLGGEVPEVAPAQPSTEQGGQLAVGEEADFAAAKAELDAQNYLQAVEKFENFLRDYQGSRLTSEAQFLSGLAYEGAGDVQPAARAFLESFSGAPDGPLAPRALFKLGSSLGTLGQQNEACLTLGEVEARFPTAPEVAEANARRQELGCL
ncbi:tol-pal system protein YbgF [Halocynthiibacter sp. C4]|uniref:tol-pal system protein YbgF n=1 Tax=Halocynthiibacter sp. C4 TaxID=2992758 RepID=UPI00237AB0C1|nr:tol-pal system protein YbgF [Halocynthiibacter sp. C4]MDE0588688.1 tol-pal system protein YbgF [Halocynthiibacter sp. C4]